jgi:predicted  nucleic acid-binding Zn-ribbon protein
MAKQTKDKSAGTPDAAPVQTPDPVIESILSESSQPSELDSLRAELAEAQEKIAKLSGMLELSEDRLTALQAKITQEDQNKHTQEKTERQTFVLVGTAKHVHYLVHRRDIDEDVQLYRKGS